MHRVIMLPSEAVGTNLPSLPLWASDGTSYPWYSLVCGAVARIAASLTWPTSLCVLCVFRSPLLKHTGPWS